MTDAAPSEATPELGGATAIAGLKPYSQVLAVFLCGAFAFLDLYSTQPLLPLLARVFHASEGSVSLTISAPTLGVAFSSALLAVLGEHVNRKRLIVGSMTALAVTTAFGSTAPSLPVLTGWRLLQGLLTPGVFIITIAFITEEWPARLVPRVMSFYVAGSVFGGFVGRVAGGMLAEGYGWRPMFLILGIAGVAGAAVTQRLLKRPTANSGMGMASRFAPVRNNLHNPRLVATFGIGFCMLFTLVSLFSYITFYLANAPFHLSTAALGWLFSVYLFGLVTTLTAGSFLARIGLQHGMIAAVGLSLAGVLLTLIPSLLLVGIGLSLASSGVFVSQTCANSFLRDAAPEGSRVSAAGMYICSYYIGGTVGGVLPGLFWRYAGWPGCVALICTVLAIAALTAIYGWKPRTPSPI
jgi:MFS transporter, YNFM family, putative membrane transport protein